MKRTNDGTSFGIGLFASYLAVAAGALAAGVVLGGWLAFETGHWRGFKSWVESMADGAVLLAAGLLVAVAVLGLVMSYRTATT
jgi:F0F1-type ATP synthase membrane subunit c/vacuolar-type H+-ATPase subunit K